MAARGQASPEQLKILGVVIQQVTQEMEAEGHRVKPPGGSTGASASASAPASAPSSSSSSPAPVKGNATHAVPSQASASPSSSSATAKPRKSGGGSSKKKKKKTGEDQGEGETSKKEYPTQQTPMVKQEVAAPADAQASASTPAKKKKKKQPKVSDGTSGASMTTTDTSAASPSTTNKPVSDGSAPAPATSSKTGVKTGPATPSASPRSGKPSSSARPPSDNTAPISRTAPAPLHRPPLIVVEFPENPSVRFYLPLWCSLISRRKVMFQGRGEELVMDAREDEAKRAEVKEGLQVDLDFLAPVKGSLSDRVVNGPGEEDKESGKEEKKAGDAGAEGSASGDPQQPPEGAGSAAESSQQAVTVNETAIKKEPQQPSAPAPRYALHMTLTGQGDTGALWDTLDRVPGVKSYGADGQELPVTASGSEAEADVDVVAEGKTSMHSTIAQAIAHLPPRRHLKVNATPPSGLSDHLRDKFIPTQRDVHSLQGSTQSQSTRSKRSSRRSDLPSARDFVIMEPGTDSTSVALGSSSLSSKRRSETDPTAPPRKKRNVITHNPDGSLKTCNHCGCSYPPMWRRGPDGVGTLCNACGSRWKVGRLILHASRGGGGAVEQRNQDEDKDTEKASAVA